eukprot:6803714-Pyramimonas_sp.AAC.1
MVTRLQGVLNTLQGQRSLEGAVLDFCLEPVNSVTVDVVETSGKEYNDAVESKALTQQELGSPREQIEKRVINKLANADMSKGQQVRLAQGARSLMNTALEESPAIKGEIFKGRKSKRA